MTSRIEGPYKPIHFTHAERKLKPTRKALTVRVMPFSKWRVKVIKRSLVNALGVTFFEHKRYFVRVTRALAKYRGTDRKYCFSWHIRTY